MVNITRILSITDVEPIVKLAVANYVDLISVAVRKDGPISSLSKTIIGIEIRTYLEEILSPSPRIPLEILLAKDGHNEIIGFAIHIKAQEEHCGLSYCAVAQSHRNQGIFRAMIDDIKSRFTSIGLTCHLGSVPLYERLGFTVYGQDDAQIEMGWGAYNPDTQMFHFGFDQHVDVIAVKETFYRTNGPSKSKKIRNSANAYHATRKKEVEDFIKSRQLTSA